MSSIETKLKMFESVALNKAAKERDAIIKDIDEDTQRQLSEAKADINRKADEAYDKGHMDNIREHRRITGEAEEKGRASLIAKRNDIEESVFNALTDRLRKFVKTSEYDSFFMRRLNETLEYVKKLNIESRIVVSFTLKDMTIFAEEIKETCAKAFPNADIEVKEAEDDILGGVVCYLQEKNVLIDNSIRNMIRERRGDFIVRSNLSLR